MWFQFQSLAKTGDRLVELILFRQRIAEIIVCLGAIRLQLQGAVKASDGLGELSRRTICFA